MTEFGGHRRVHPRGGRPPDLGGEASGGVATQWWKRGVCSYSQDATRRRGGAIPYSQEVAVRSLFPVQSRCTIREKSQ